MAIIKREYCDSFLWIIITFVFVFFSFSKYIFIFKTLFRSLCSAGRSLGRAFHFGKENVSTTTTTTKNKRKTKPKRPLHRAPVPFLPDEKITKKTFD